MTRDFKPPLPVAAIVNPDRAEKNLNKVVEGAMQKLDGMAGYHDDEMALAAKQTLRHDKALNKGWPNSEEVCSSDQSQAKEKDNGS